MTTVTAGPDREPAEEIRIQIEALLAELPEPEELAVLPAHADLDGLAERLGAAHDVLVRALESAERG